MWYKISKNRIGFGGGILVGPPVTNNQIASDPEAEQQSAEALAKTMMVPLTELPLEWKLRLFEQSNANGLFPTPRALNLTAKEPSAGISDHHQTTNPSGDATDGSVWTEYKEDNPDPSQRRR